VYEVLLERSVERALKRLSQSDFTRILVTLKGTVNLFST